MNEEGLTTTPYISKKKAVAISCARTLWPQKVHSGYVRKVKDVVVQLQNAPGKTQTGYIMTAAKELASIIATEAFDLDELVMRLRRYESHSHSRDQQRRTFINGLPDHLSSHVLTPETFRDEQTRVC